jgi:hypothetical protein
MARHTPTPAEIRAYQEIARGLRKLKAAQRRAAAAQKKDADAAAFSIEPTPPCKQKEGGT